MPSVNILGTTIQQDDLFKGIEGACAASAAYQGLCTLSKFAAGQGDSSDIARGVMAGAMASVHCAELKQGLWQTLEAVDKYL